MPRIRLKPFWLALLPTLAAGCDLPRDPAGTLERARGGVLRVGAATAPPWVVHRTDGRVAGVEAELVAEFARTLGARVEWHRGSADELLAKLEKRELDVVIAGLTAATPWATHVGITRPYRIDGPHERVLAVAAGENATLVALDRVIESRRSGP